MERRHRYYARKFLNLPGHGASAHVIGEVISEYEHDRWWNDVTLIIGDCSRIVSFELSLSPECRENTFHKLDTLIEVVKGLRAAIEELAEEVDRRNR